MRRVCRSSSKAKKKKKLPRNCQMLCASKPGVVPMSHLRAKFQQTSGQRLHTSHHFPAQFQNILARRAGTATIIPMSKKMFQSCLHRPPYPPPPAPVSPSLLPGGWKQLKERAIKTDWYLLPALSCERRCPAIAFAK